MERLKPWVSGARRDDPLGALGDILVIGLVALPIWHLTENSLMGSFGRVAAAVIGLYLVLTAVEWLNRLVPDIRPPENDD